MGAMEAFLEAVKHLRALYWYAGAGGAAVLMLVLPPLYPEGHFAQPMLIVVLVICSFAGAIKSVEWMERRISAERAREDAREQLWKSILTSDSNEAAVLAEAVEKDTRTILCTHGSMTGWSLVAKGLADYGGPANPEKTGSFMVPFVIRAAVWDLLMERKPEVLELRDAKANAKVGYA